MDFDPRTTKLHSQEEVDECLVKYDICLSPEIKVEYCPHGADVALALPNSHIYMHPQVLTLGLRLPLTKFASSILTFYRVTPSQLSGVAWRARVRDPLRLECP